MELIPVIRDSVRSLFRHCHFTYEVASFDEDLYRECIADATRRGYPVDGDMSVTRNLRVGVFYAANAGAHLCHLPTQIWMALYTSCAAFVDEVSERFPEEIPNVYHFSDRFARGEQQGNSVLEAWADIARRTSDLFRPLASQLIITSTLNFITGALLEHETSTMKISAAATQYPTYQRALSGAPDTFSFMAFPSSIPVSNYIQAIAEMGPFICNVNDIVSFYKEELAGETTNQVSTFANRTNKSKLEALGDMTKTTTEMYDRILSVLEASPEACEAFKLFMEGYLRFHTSSPRYRMEELGLNAL